MELRSIGISAKNNKQNLYSTAKGLLLFYYFVYPLDSSTIDTFSTNRSSHHLPTTSIIYYESSTTAIKILHFLRLSTRWILFRKKCILSFSPHSPFQGKYDFPYRQDNKMYVFSKCFGIIITISLDYLSKEKCIVCIRSSLSLLFINPRNMRPNDKIYSVQFYDVFLKSIFYCNLVFIFERRDSYRWQ